MTSKIEWTDETWNPIIGCSRVSAGCENCYAERMAARLATMPHTKERYAGLTTGSGKAARWIGKTRLVPEVLAKPLRWRKPRRVFVCSMSDLFHESTSFEDIAAVFGVMAATPHITYQVLTKRPERALAWVDWLRDDVSGLYFTGGAMALSFSAQAIREAGLPMGLLEGVGADGTWPLPNVWLGVSAENQATADERIPLLLQCPATVRFVSCEPLLGPVDLRGHLLSTKQPAACVCGHGHGFTRCPNYGRVVKSCHVGGCECADFSRVADPLWVIAGGESGPGARPMHPDWARSLRDQCQAAGVPFMFKQWGEHVRTDQMTDALWSAADASDAGMNHGETYRAGKSRAGRELDGVVHNELPGAASCDS